MGVSFANMLGGTRFAAFKNYIVFSISVLKE